MSRIAGRLWLPWILLLGLAAARPGLAGDAAIVLTNEDVEALHARSPAPAEPAPPGALAAPAETAIATTSKEPAPGNEYQGPVSSWRDEYYRLKSEAMSRALERGDPIDLRDGSDGPPPEVDPGAAAPAATDSASACVYDRDGRLIHTPRGADCRPQRGAPGNAGATDATQSDSQRSCVYGAQGELLLAPAGRRCERGPGARSQAR